MHCCLEPLAQHVIGFLPVQRRPKSIKAKLHKIFLCNIIWSFSDSIAQGFDLRNVLPRVLRQHCPERSLIQSFLKPLGKDRIRFSALQCCRKSIKTTLYKIFIIKSCLEPLGKHFIGFLVLQCCPKSIKTTLHRTFSYEKLSGASPTIFHRGLTCAMLSQEY